MGVVRSVTVGGGPVVFHSELVLAVREAPAAMVAACGGPVCFVDLAYGGFQQLGEDVETVAAKVWAPVDPPEEWRQMLKAEVLRQVYTVVPLAVAGLAP